MTPTNKKTFVFNSTVDLTSTSNETEALNFGKPISLILDECYVEITTALATDATTPVLQLINVGKSNFELATISAFADADAIGKIHFFKPVSTGGNLAQIENGETFKVKVKTAGTDGTSAAGVVKVYLTYSLDN